MAKKKVNPWAICHSSTGPKKTAKFERCVMDVKKKHGMEGLEADDIRKISEMLTDDPDLFVEEGLPMAPDEEMVGGDAQPPMQGDMPDDGMPADMAPEGDMPAEEEGVQWVVVKMPMGEEGGEAEACGPYMSREEADHEVEAKAGEGAHYVVARLMPAAMPGDEMGDEVGAEDLPPMGGEVPAAPPEEMGGGVPPTEGY